MKRARSNSIARLPSSKRAKMSYTSNKRRPPNWKSGDNSNANERLHYVKRTVDYGTLLGDNINPSYGTYNFSINDVPNYTELTALYDQYKICGVRFRLFPKQTQCTSLDLATQPRNARILTAIDYTDSTSPISISEVREFETCKVDSILDRVERYVKHPKYVLSSNIVTDDWCPTSNTTVNWLGIKYAIEPIGSTSATRSQEWSVEATFYLCFKNIK